jgi:hypothetical protein
VLSITLSPREPASPFIPGVPVAQRLRIHPSGDPGRSEVEAFIRETYRQRYDADVRHFAPSLIGLRDEQGDLVAAAGYRAADRGTLFLERYLDSPVESLLAGPGEVRPPRARVVEVGHLAARRPGEGRRLALLLAPHLAREGFQWVVGTLTQELRHLFVRLGIAPMALGVADPLALGEEAGRWGSYYDHRPLVLAGQLEQALDALARRRSAS